MSDWEEFLRALGGSLLIIGSMICMVFCLYKYAVCQENKDKHSNVISVLPPQNVPRTYRNLEAPKNAPFIIV
jgi:hypothetical protein